MVSKIKERFRDMGTIKSLCLEAGKHANVQGQKEPGGEHFVLFLHAGCGERWGCRKPKIEKSRYEKSTGFDACFCRKQFFSTASLAS